MGRIFAFSLNYSYQIIPTFGFFKKMMKKIRQTLLFFLTGVLILHTNSCRQDSGNAEWDVDVLAPVLKTTLTLNDLVEDSLLFANSDSSLKLIYANDFSNVIIDTLLNIPDTTVTNPLSLPLGVTVQPGLDLITMNTETRYDLKDAQLTLAIVRAGTVKVKFQNLLNTKITVNYSIPIAKLNGVPFAITRDVNANSTYIEEFDISWYELNLRGTNENSYNTIVTAFSGSTDPNGPAVQITANQPFVIIENSFTGIVPQYARGYFGSPGFETGNESAKFNFLKKIIAGQIGLEEVKLSLSLENYVGADGQIKIHNITSVNERTGVSVDLNHNILSTPVNITRASEPWINSGNVTPTFTSYVFDNSNSNIRALIENLPHRLDYSLDFKLNPLGNISSGNDFFYYEKNIETNLHLEVPMTFYASSLTLSDTLKFNADAGSAGSRIKGGSFRIITDNSFPLSAKMKLILLDSNGVKLDSLYSLTDIAAPALDTNFKSIGSAVSTLDIPIFSTTAEKLTNTGKINIKIVFDTPQAPQLLKIYAHYKMDIRIIADFTYTFNQP